MLNAIRTWKLEHIEYMKEELEVRYVERLKPGAQLARVIPSRRDKLKLSEVK